MTETRYVVDESAFSGKTAIVRVQGVRRAQSVRVNSRPYVLGCRAIVEVEKWDSLGKSPLDAYEKHLKRLEGRVKCSREEIVRCEKALADFSATPLKAINIVEPR